MGSEHTDDGFPPLPILAPRHMPKRWIGCCGGGLSCFGKLKGGKRIAPAARMREGNQVPNAIAPQSAPNQTTAIATATRLVALSLLAPPSSPASFSTPSTAQSPNCYSSPGGLASGNMFAIGPYAHETQLVSPPVFSAFTTEPSTAPLTPPPEMSHLTTPSSPDVPYAHFLSSSFAAGDPSSWDPSSSVPPTQQAPSHQDSNFFCPDTFAQFYIDHSSLPHSGGRISVSKESDAAAYSDTRNQSKQSSSTTWCKQQEAEEMGEAYRASFGFSADEIVTTTTSKYVEISDAAVLDRVDDDDDDEDDEASLFTITPFASGEQHTMNLSTDNAKKSQKKNMSTPQYLIRASSYRAQGPNSNTPDDNGPAAVRKHNSGQNIHGVVSDEEEEDGFSSNKMGNSRYGRKYPPGSSSSDAEIDYRRGGGRRRSSREGRGYFF